MASEEGGRAEEARRQFGQVRELSKDEDTIETLKRIHQELELDLEVRNMMDNSLLQALKKDFFYAQII